MKQITYADKVTINEQPNIERKNKCTADDLNEIKAVVNENAQLSMLTAKISGTSDIVPTSAGDIIPTLEETLKLGNDFAVTSSGINIGVSSGYVSVQAIVGIDCYTTPTRGVRNLVLLKNGVVIKIFAFSTGSSWFTGVIPEVIIPVELNDKIQLRVYAQANDKIKVAEERSSITLKVVQ